MQAKWRPVMRPTAVPSKPSEIVVAPAIAIAEKGHNFSAAMSNSLGFIKIGPQTCPFDMK